MCQIGNVIAKPRNSFLQRFFLFPTPPPMTCFSPLPSGRRLSRRLGHLLGMPSLPLSVRAALLTLLLSLGSFSPLADPWEGFGPLYDHFPLTLQSGSRSEAVGPLFGFQTSETERTWAFPPFVSVHRDEVTDFTEWDSLYPVLTFDRFGLDYRLQILQMLSFAGGATMDETGKQRFTLFPFYFHQRSPDPNLNYTAVVPFYGHLKNRLFRDEIYFVMFPAYLQTRKREVVTDNYLAPFFHVRHGEGLKGWQFWPLYGREHKAITFRTNSLDEAELIGGHDKLFVVWPFYIRNN